MSELIEDQKFRQAQANLESALSPYPRATQIKAVEMAMLMSDLRLWANRVPVLERNDCSRLHKLKEASRAGALIDLPMDGPVVAAPPNDSLDGIAQTFVVKHDWAAAFSNAEGMADEFKLPYEVCAFEFRISGRNVIAILVEVDATRQFTAFVEAREYWYGFGISGKDEPVVSFIWNEIRAICVALDAEVATHSVVRASVKLNDKRTKAGKIPLVDYRVVDLSRKHRITNPAHGDGGTKKRLHFRRGHWRHFEESKTWVKWCLVGDPDLGFISKHYSL